MFKAELQVELYYLFLFFLVCITAFFISAFPMQYQKRVPYNNLKIVLLAVIIICFIGYREWWVEEVFSDSIRYGYKYLRVTWDQLNEPKDIGFDLLTLSIKSLGFSNVEQLVIDLLNNGYKFNL